MNQVLIDKLTVPANAKVEFIQRMNMNREIIKQQPGFIKDEIFQNTDTSGDLIFITIATWESAEFLHKAKEVVQAEYKRTGFNMTEFCQRLNIKIERAIYNATSITHEKGNQSSKTEKQLEQVLLGKISVPDTAKNEFIERLNVNNEIIRNQNGFLKDEAFEQQDEKGNVNFFTVVIWKDSESIKKTNEVLQEEYKRTNFNMMEFCQKRSIKIERLGIYQQIEN